MNNLSSYCGLVDAKITASDKNLPVLIQFLAGRSQDETKCQISQCEIHRVQTLTSFPIQLLTLHLLFRALGMKHKRSLLTNNPVFLSVNAP